MRQQVTFSLGSIPKKLVIDLRLLVDSNDSFKPGANTIKSADGQAEYTNIKLFPTVNIGIYRQMPVVEGVTQRREFNPNDTLMLNKYNVPIFINNLDSLIKAFQTPELFRYIDGRLEVDEKLAASSRKLFIVAQKTVEMVPVVIDQDDNKIEGIRMKFNVDESTVLLSLNDMESLSYMVQKVDMDLMALALYKDYMQKKSGEYKAPF